MRYKSFLFIFINILIINLVWCKPLFAQDYPNKPIRIITGSSPDFPVRIYGSKMTDAWGQQIIAESIPTASGKIAAETVARSKPDGYTLLNAVPSLMIANAVQGNYPDLSKDFAPVAITNLLPFVFVVAKDIEVNTIEGFIKLVKSQPGKINYGATNGTFPHLAIELFKSMTKTDFFHIPFKNTNDTALALVSGQIQATVIPYGSVAALHQSGKVVVLAVTSSDRSPLLPDIPTLSESGLKGYNLLGWNAFVAPVGTPAEIINQLNAQIRKSFKDPEVIKQLKAIGNDPGLDLSPQQLGDFFKAEVSKWNKLVNEVKIKID